MSWLNSIHVPPTSTATSTTTPASAASASRVSNAREIRHVRLIPHFGWPGPVVAPSALLLQTAPTVPATDPVSGWSAASNADRLSLGTTGSVEI